MFNETSLEEKESVERFSSVDKFRKRVMTTSILLMVLMDYEMSE